MEPSMTDDQIKKLVKAALVEVLEERRDLIQEALEDMALARAIEEGERTELVGRDEVVKLLERQE